MLLIGEKLDGGLYTQEELEVARASAERLLDMQGGTEMARRLMALQRQRLAETRVIDAQTRRVLHDDVLPRLHAVVLAASAGSETQELIPQLTEVHSSISNLLRTMPAPAAGTIGPGGIIGALRSTINTELRGSFDRVEWETIPEAETASAALSPLAAEVLFHAAREAVRNAAKYGRGNRKNVPLHLRIALAYADGIVLTIEDNGIGIDGIAPSDGGSGQGMALHGTMMAIVGGSMSVESVAGQYTRVTLTLPTTGPTVS
jgi:signal transduction histidine kinase